MLRQKITLMITKDQQPVYATYIIWALCSSVLYTCAGLYTTKIRQLTQFQGYQNAHNAFPRLPQGGFHNSQLQTRPCLLWSSLYFITEVTTFRRSWNWICLGPWIRHRLAWRAWAAHRDTGLIPGLCPANERRRYKVTPSLIGWVQT